MKLPANSPAPYSVLPTPQQVAWHEMETYAFVHFRVNTYTKTSYLAASMPANFVHYYGTNRQ